MPAFRNNDKCTKDCMCLLVCPTGAANTEDGFIDKKKCAECAACINACPSRAIYMVPKKYPSAPQKTAAVVASLRSLGYSKVQQGLVANAIASASDSPVTSQFASAIEASNLIMAENLFKEAGFRLPQSEQVRGFLSGMSERDDWDESLMRPEL